MPIDISEYATPRWIRMRTRYPWVLDKNYNYKNLTIRPGTNLDRYNASSDRGDGWKAPGYNVNHNSTRIETVRTNIDTTGRSYKPY
jgi:hypothetical protein